MEQPQYLIDTNVVIDYLGNKLPVTSMEFINGLIDNSPIISIVTKIEILSFNASKEHYKVLCDFITDATVLDLTGNVVDTCIEIRKKHKTKLPDAIIAATALVYDLILISRNTSDFKNIDDLTVTNPHTMPLA